MSLFSLIIRNSKQYFIKGKMWAFLEQLTSVLNAILLSLSIIYTKKLFEIINNENKIYDDILKAVVLLFVIMVLSQLVSSFSSFLLSKVSYSNMGKFMIDLQLKLQKISTVKFEDASFLDNLQKAKECVEYESLGHFASICLKIISFYLVYIIFVGSYLFSVSRILPLIIIIAFVPAITGQIFYIKIFSKLVDQNAKLKRKNDYYRKVIVDRKFFKETRLLGAFNYFFSLYNRSLLLLNKRIYKSEKKAFSMQIVLDLISFLGLLAAILLLFYQTINREISVSSFAAIFVALNQIFEIIEELVIIHMKNGSETISHIKNFYEILDMKEDEKIDRKLNLEKGVIASNVYFSYPNQDEFCLKNINLEIKKGETIAIVGENGSGKTTLSKILLGIYKPIKGRVEIFGVDTKESDNGDILENISAVFQNFARYKMTLSDNVSMSNHLIKDNRKIENVLKKADFDKKLELDTMLSTEFNGIDLSGGLWQRLAVARAIYKDFELIALDEPTAAIDPIEEKRIFEKFKQITKDKTSIIITHRLNSTKFADRIVVMDKGEIIDIGDHNSLIKSCSLYEKMYNSQAKWYK
ncbi:MAG: ABC transporter ATP-binding protein [Tissierellia bacterium]|nr:ABC transporter ATP-binding protein [Tissierellia bacterium]